MYNDISKCLKTDEIDLVILNKAPLSMQYGVWLNKKAEISAFFIFVTIVTDFIWNLNYNEVRVKETQFK